jgi:DNA replication and repair protein RecF
MSPVTNCSLIIKELKIQNLRNIGQADLNLTTGINIIQGGNGAGKTTLLESVYLLARARSFRQTHKNTLIREKEKTVTVFVNAERDSGEHVKIGFQREGSENRVKINTSRVKKLSQLAAALPIAIITPHSHRIIEESPEHRRRLLNWGVFHVEHSYQSILSKYNRALSQRNAALKNNSQDPTIWDDQITQYADEITRLNREYVDEWRESLLDITREIDIFKEISLEYKKGWQDRQSLKESLKDKILLDQKRGFTSVGPHRADIHVDIRKRAAKQQLSRGQQKLLVTMMMLAQSNIQRRHQKERAIILYDDFQSELDKSTQIKILEVIQSSKCQAIITMIDRDRDISGKMVEGDQMFHVEHGVFSSLT